MKRKNCILCGNKLLIGNANGPITCLPCHYEPGHKSDPMIECFYVDRYHGKIIQITAKHLLFGFPDGSAIAYSQFDQGSWTTKPDWSENEKQAYKTLIAYLKQDKQKLIDEAKEEIFNLTSLINKNTIHLTRMYS